MGHLDKMMSTLSAHSLRSARPCHAQTTLQAHNRRHRGQSAERIAERGGFGYWEITELLGREPNTWEPRT